jgi:arginine N-succinyltransferase
MLMMVIRPVQMDDLNELVNLAAKTGSGLTTLPNNRDYLEKKIESSQKAFNLADTTLSDDCYLLVLEDTDSGKIVGTSGIIPAVGKSRPFYTYKVNKTVHHSPSVNVYRESEFLTLTNDFTNQSELCSLFLSPEFRGGRNGTLLSRSRFTLIANHSQRFSSHIIAEMRGFSDENGRSPFWEAVGRHFFNMEFDQADRTNGEGNQQFIAELMPHHPIYINLLSKEAQAVIGDVHPHTKPALKMLEREGLTYNGYVDIFDAGPTISCEMNRVRSIENSFLGSVKITDNLVEKGVHAIVANMQLKDFRACIVTIEKNSSEIKINQAMAEQLLLKQNDDARVVLC